jgi:hypothetical protein
MTATTFQRAHGTGKAGAPAQGSHVGFLGSDVSMFHQEDWVHLGMLRAKSGPQVLDKHLNILTSLFFSFETTVEQSFQDQGPFWNIKPT